LSLKTRRRAGFSRCFFSLKIKSEKFNLSASRKPLFQKSKVSSLSTNFQRSCPVELHRKPSHFASLNVGYIFGLDEGSCLSESREGSRYERVRPTWMNFGKFWPDTPVDCSTSTTCLLTLDCTCLLKVVLPTLLHSGNNCYSILHTFIWTPTNPLGRPP
jgi:hypothetical protein